MPIFPQSRNRYNTEYQDDDGNYYLDDREPYRFENEIDNLVIEAKEGDMLWHIAHKAFAGERRPCGYWWAIAEYQPDPIIDPTIQFSANQKIVSPSKRVLNNKIFNSEQRIHH